MDQINKVGLMLFMMGLPLFREAGWLGVFGIILIVTGNVLFMWQTEAHLTPRIADLCQECGTNRIAGENKCRVCGIRR